MKKIAVLMLLVFAVTLAAQPSWAGDRATSPYDTPTESSSDSSSDSGVVVAVALLAAVIVGILIYKMTTVKSGPMPFSRTEPGFELGRGGPVLEFFPLRGEQPPHFNRLSPDTAHEPPDAACAQTIIRVRF